eukprot:11875622-Alexandrium_andersonii.AAC.1
MAARICWSSGPGSSGGSLSMMTSFQRPHCSWRVLPYVPGRLCLAQSCQTFSLARRTFAHFWRSVLRH